MIFEDLQVLIFHLKSQSFMNGLRFNDIDYCKYGFNYRNQTRLWNNLTNWKPRALCKKDCGKVVNNKHIEAAQRAPSGKRENWGENYVKHKQEDLYKKYLLFWLVRY